MNKYIYKCAYINFLYYLERNNMYCSGMQAKEQFQNHKIVRKIKGNSVNIHCICIPSQQVTFSETKCFYNIQIYTGIK